MNVASQSPSRTPADLRQEVREQVQLLTEYCRLFDGGAQPFAKPMATALRVLLHTNPKPNSNTRALLDHFQLRSGRWYDVAGPISRTNLLNSVPLVIMRMSKTADGTTATHVPKLAWIDSRPTRVAFTDWWTRPVAHSHELGSVSRMSLVRELADRDGGAHVDTNFSDAYAALRAGTFGGFSGLDSKGLVPFDGLHQASIRSIAHETLLSLHRYAAWAFDAPYAWEDSGVRYSTETFGK